MHFAGSRRSACFMINKRLRYLRQKQMRRVRPGFSNKRTAEIGLHSVAVVIFPALSTLFLCRTIIHSSHGRITSRA